MSGLVGACLLVFSAALLVGYVASAPLMALMGAL